MAGLVALLPLIGMAANPVFSDLDQAAAIHQGNIQAIGNAGITTGLEDPDHPGQRLYNPKGLVTREEMASFLARTAGLGGNAPVANAQMAVTAQSAVNAQTAITAQNAVNAQHAVSAQDASTVRGFAPSGLVRVAGSPARDVAIAVPPTYTTLASTTLIAPSDGYILIVASVDLYNVGQGGCPCNVLVNTGASGGGGSGTVRVTVASATNAHGTGASTYLARIGPGSHTVTVTGYQDTGTGSLVGVGQLTALFIPFDGDGNVPVGP